MRREAGGYWGRPADLIREPMRTSLIGLSTPSTIKGLVTKGESSVRQYLS